MCVFGCAWHSMAPWNFGPSNWTKHINLKILRRIVINRIKMVVSFSCNQIEKGYMTYKTSGHHELQEDKQHTTRGNNNTLEYNFLEIP